jgi:hypothetical protein
VWRGSGRMVHGVTPAMTCAVATGVARMHGHASPACMAWRAAGSPPPSTATTRPHSPPRTHARHACTAHAHTLGTHAWHPQRATSALPPAAQHTTAPLAADTAVGAADTAGEAAAVGSATEEAAAASVGAGAASAVATAVATAVVSTHTSGSVKEPAYKTLIRTPYVQISQALYDPYKRVGLAEPLVNTHALHARHTHARTVCSTVCTHAHRHSREIVTEKLWTADLDRLSLVIK